MNSKAQNQNKRRIEVEIRYKNVKIQIAGWEQRALMRIEELRQTNADRTLEIARAKYKDRKRKIDAMIAPGKISIDQLDHIEKLIERRI